jgi:hypothetical protein
MSSRVQKIPTVTGIELRILAKREWWPLIFLPVWLAFWTVGGLVAVNWMIHPGPDTPRSFVLLWLIGWALGEIWAAYQFLWTAFGKEIVKVREGALSIKRDILGYGRIRSYPIGTVANLRASGFFPSDSYWSNYLAQMKLAGGTVGFESRGRTERFGIQLKEEEARQVVQELSPYLS